MPGHGADGFHELLNHAVEAFEVAHHRDGRADIEDFLPPVGHPLRMNVLCELVRVDLEYSWRRCSPRCVDHYRSLFPELFEDEGLGRLIHFEESRLRRQAGRRPADAGEGERRDARA